MKSTKLALMAVLMLALTFSFSCSSDDGGSGGGTSSPSGGGDLSSSSGGVGGSGSIINADNEAWIRCRPDKCFDYGMIFKQNGEITKISKSEDDGSWDIDDVIAYSIKGNQLCQGNKCYDYSISGNTLTIAESETDKPTFTRTSGVYIRSEYTGGSCDVNDYGEVEIDTQTWMAKNWGCYVSGSKCYGNKPANCIQYGRMYNWASAMTACPSGWHLPSSDEWKVLANYAGGTSIAGTKLKAQDGWNADGNGEDTYGFAALPGGYDDAGDFRSIGYRGDWWSSSAYPNSADILSINSFTEGVNITSGGKENVRSVRCVKDN